MTLGLKFIFFGTPEFAAIVLKKLIKIGLIPEVIVCNPDKPIGRKHIIASPPAKILAEKHNIKIYQPEKLEIGKWKMEIGKIKPDFAVVVSYAKIIPKEILEIPRLGTIGAHPSLLPKFRGPSPIQSFILSGEAETGVTLFLMDEKIDHGPIFSQQKLEFPTSNFQFSTLQKELAELSADLLIKILPDIEEKIKNAKPQDETRATYTKKFKTEDAFIKPEDLEIAVNCGGEAAMIIDKKIRALNPEPGTWSIKKNKRMKILEAILTPDGKLKLKKIQFEGKNPVFCQL